MRIKANNVEVDIINDFYLIYNQCRNSYLKLDGLKKILKNYIYVKDAINLSILGDFSKRIENLMTQFEQLDQRYLNPPVIKYQGNQVEKGTSPSQIFNILHESIILRENIDLLRLDILVKLNENSKVLLKSLIKKENEFVKNIALHSEFNLIINEGLNRSSEEDKRKNYYIDCNTKDEELKKSLKDDGIKFPFKIHVKDYIYEITYLEKTFFENHKQFSRLLLLDLPKIKEDEYFNTIKDQQFKLNSKLSILSIIVGIIGVLTLVINIWRLCLQLNSTNQKLKNTSQIETTFIQEDSTLIKHDAIDKKK